MADTGKNELYEAAKGGYTMAGALARQIIDKHGAATVYAAITNIGEAAGRSSGERLKQGTEKFASQLLESQRANGWSSEIKVEGNKVTLRNNTCPCHAGYLAGGLSYEEAKRMCYSFWSRFPSSAKSVNQNVKDYWIEHFRTPEADYCLEVFEVK